MPPEEATFLALRFSSETLLEVHLLAAAAAVQRENFEAPVEEPPDALQWHVLMPGRARLGAGAVMRLRASVCRGLGSAWEVRCGPCPNSLASESINARRFSKRHQIPPG